MSDTSSVHDSQQDDELDQVLSWEFIHREQTRSTRKARQLDKLYKELHPLNNEYKNIPTSKSRNLSFTKNNQFTVTAAEFLNLSSKAELDQIYEDGYTKDEIENLLENKYQEKKQFFTDLNLRHHRFKMKNFDTWRSVSNSHSATNSTFSSEEEHLAQISKPQQLRLKRINNRPLRMYKTRITMVNTTITTTTRATESIMNPPSSPIRHQTKPSALRHDNIPLEDGLIGIPSTDDIHSGSSIMIVNDIPDRKDNEQPDNTEQDDKLSHMLDHSSSPISQYFDASNILKTEVAHDKSSETPEKHSDTQVVNNSHHDLINDFFNLDTHNDVFHDNASQSSENEVVFSQQSFDKNALDSQMPDTQTPDLLIPDVPMSDIPMSDDPMPDSQILDTQKELHEIFSDNKETTNVSSENGNPVEIHEEPPTIHILSSPTKVPEIPRVDYSISGRSLRHRTIVNRNPYLVDRAEYLGLSTKYELISLAEEGKTDDDILNYLDSKYQRRRKERKEKDVGYGPYAKKSFFEIMSGKDQHTNISENLNVDSITDSYQLNPNDVVSDQEFELSMDEESDINDEPDTEEGDERKNNTFMNLLESFGEVGNSSDNPKAKREKLPFNLNEILTDKPEIDHMVQKRKRKHKSSSETSSKEKSKKRKTKEPGAETSTRVHRSKFSKEKHSPTSHSSRDKQSSASASPRLQQSSTFKPYTMDFLTLSDEEPSHVEKRARSTNGEAKEKDKYYKKTADTCEKKSKSSISNILLKVPSYQEKHDKPSKPKCSTSSEKKKTTSNKTKSTEKHTVGTYAPLSDPNFVFNRSVNMGTYQKEVVGPTIITNPVIETVTEFDVENARNTGLNLLPVDQPEKPQAEFKPTNKIQELWNKYKEFKDLNKHRYQFIINLKPLDYKNLEIPQKFLGSSFLAKTLSENDDFYRSKDIKLEFASMKLVFSVPLKPETTLAQVVAFHDILLGELKTDHISKSQTKQLRKALIDLIMILSNVKKDCPVILHSIGLEMNSFLNKYKKSTESNQVTFCLFAPFFLVYMKMFQKFLPAWSEYISSFRNTEVWLCKKIVFNVCNISFEKVFIHTRNTLLESIFLFLKCTSNPLQYVESIQHSKNVDILNVFNFLYFCNAHHPVEMDWEFFTTVLNKLCDKIEKPEGDLITIKNIFASVLKLNRELHWDLEDQLVIRMFRLLAEYKFENIDTRSVDKPTIYPNIPGTDSLEEEDGCLDIYFKILNIYTKQYLSENTKSLVERLIPIRSTFGYSPVQLQNRAKVLLMMVYTFDQDLLSSLESILNDMIRNGSIYSIKTSLALIRTIIRQTPKRPYSLVRKYLPSLIGKIHHIAPDREIVTALKDLIYSVNELLNGQDISHLKRMLDFFGIILKFKYADVDPAFDTILSKTFMIISQQYEFLQGIEISPKDESRLKKSLLEIISNAKLRLLDEKITNVAVNKLLLKYWLYASMKIKQPAIQLLYTEWHYFGDVKLREKYEVAFFTYLLQMFEVSNIREDILCIFFKHLPMIFTDLSPLFQQLNKTSLLLIGKHEYDTISSQMFKFRRIRITIECLSKLFKDSNEQLIFNVLKSFLVSLKVQLINHEAKQYIKEIGLYLYTVANDRFDIPEWDYLVSKLRLETIEGSLSKKIQFVETVDDSIMIFEKVYVGLVSGGSTEVFSKQFTEFVQLQVDRERTFESLCSLISFHIECLLKQKKEHWVHLDRWIGYFRQFVTFQVCKLDISLVCKVFCNLAKLSKLYPSCNEFRCNYYSILSEVYHLLDWVIRMFVGFADFQLFLNNCWYFAGMDPTVDNRSSDYSKVPVLIAPAVISKLVALYQSSDQTIHGSSIGTLDERSMFVLEEKLQKQRAELVKSWNLPEMKTVAS